MTTPPPIPVDDAARVAVLHSYGVLDTGPSEDLDAIVRLARAITGAPRAFVNLIDTDRQWTAAAAGAVAEEVPRGEAMCPHLVAGRETVQVRDASLDHRWHDNPYVDGRYDSVRMYAGVPLVAPEGHAVGVLCAIDTEVRDLSADQVRALEDLARGVVMILELRRPTTRLTAAVEEARRRADHDALTGLVSREVVLAHLEVLLERGASGLVMYADLDRFKQVNDDHGHDAGDDVLMAVAARLRAALRANDVVARLGGDEFLIVVEGEWSDAAAAAMAGRLAALVAEPIAVPGHDVEVGLSVGICRFGPGSVLADLVRSADQAMYRDKRGAEV